MGRVGFAGMVMCLSVACSQGPDINYSGPTVNWPAYGGGPGGGHFSRAAQITPANVSALAL
jgi:glucose dehydrogenase